MCKNAVFILHFCSWREPVSMRKEKPRKPLEEQKCRMKTAFLHISAQHYIYIFCFPTTLHTSTRNPTQ